MLKNFFKLLLKDKPHLSEEEKTRLSKIKIFEQRIDSLLDSCAYTTVANMVDNGHELTYKQIRKFFLAFQNHLQSFDTNEWFQLSDSILKQNKKNKDQLFYCVEVMMLTHRMNYFFDKKEIADYQLKNMNERFIMSLTYIPFITQFIQRYEEKFVQHFSYDRFLHLLHSSKDLPNATAIRNSDELLKIMNHIEKTYYKNAKNDLVDEMKNIYGLNNKKSLEEKIKDVHQAKAKELFKPEILNEKLLFVYNSIQFNIDDILTIKNNNSLFSTFTLEDRKTFEYLVNRDLPEILAAFTSLPEQFRNTSKTQDIFEENLSLINDKLQSICLKYAQNQIELLEIKKQYLKSTM